MVHGHKKHAAFNLPIFEKLEGREMFSGSVPMASMLALSAENAAPAAIVAAAIKTPKLKAIVSTAGTGLTAEYFQDSSFENAYLLRNDATVKLAPSKRDSATTLANSVRWTGQVAPSYSEAYSFSVIASGGARLWINGQLLIDQATSTGGNFRSAVKINLVAGERYAVELEYARHSAPGTRVQLLWSSLHQKQGLVPQKAMFPDTTVTLPATTAGLIGQYYIGKDFNQLVMQRVDPTINFSFGTSTPSYLIPSGSSFSIRWTGQIVPKYSETYTFKTNSDDGVRLYVDDELLINDFTSHALTTDTASITLVAGQAYDIRMDYYQSHGLATAQLLWSSPSQASQIVPSSSLSSTPAATAGSLITNVISSNSINLSWTGSASAIGYLVEESTDGGATFTTIATTAANVLQYEVDNLNPATAYTFRIAPVGSSDTSLPSNATTAWTATNSPANVTASSASSTSANVSWDSVDGAMGYAIYTAADSSTQTASLHTRSLLVAGIDAPDFQQIGTVGADVTSFLATDLTPGTQYQFTVRSLNAAGTLSALSNTAAATTAELPPGTLTAVPSANSVSLIWTDVRGETGFAIDRSLTGVDGWDEITTMPANVLTYTDNSIQPGTTYYYRIRSLNAGGASDPSTPIQTTTTLNAPATLANGLTTALGTLLSWADVPGETGFLVLESTDGGSTFSQIAITPANVTNFAVTGLTASTPYQFEVEALNSATMPSAPSGVTSLVTTTAAPASLIATGLSTTQAHLSWNDVAGETGFKLQRSLDGVTGWSTIATLPASVLSYLDTTLLPGTNYFYRVSATNGGGDSSPSAAASALTIPAAPMATLTGLSTAQSQLSWAAVSGATQYLVERSSNGLTNWTTAATGVESAVSAIVSNLTPSTVYYYRVTASNATGTSAPSIVVSQMSAPTAIYSMDSTLYGATTVAASTLGPASASVYALNMTAGTSTLIGQLLPGAYAVQRNPADGTLWYTVGSTLNTPTVYKWDPNTGNNTMVALAPLLAPLNRGAFDSGDGSWLTDTAGNLYHALPNVLGLTRVATISLSGVPLASGTGNMVFGPNGSLYLANNGSIYTVNTTTGALTPYIQLGLNNVNIVFGNTGELYATDSNGHLYSVTNITETLLGSTNLPTFTSLTALPLFTDLGITAASTTNAFAAGTPSGYTVNITNSGPSTADSINVTVTLGTGVTFTSLAGTGWTAIAGAASTQGQTVVLTYSGLIVANGYAPQATLNVAIGSSAHASAVTTFAVACDQFDTSITNNLAVVTTPVI